MATDWIIGIWSGQINGFWPLNIKQKKFRIIYFSLTNKKSISNLRNPRQQPVCETLSYLRNLLILHFAWNDVDKQIGRNPTWWQEQRKTAATTSIGLTGTTYILLYNSNLTQNAASLSLIFTHKHSCSLMVHLGHI